MIHNKFSVQYFSRSLQFIFVYLNARIRNASANVASSTVDAGRTLKEAILDPKPTFVFV